MIITRTMPEHTGCKEGYTPEMEENLICELKHWIMQIQGALDSSNQSM